MIATSNRRLTKNSTRFGMPKFSMDAEPAEMREFHSLTLPVGRGFEIDGDLLAAHAVDQEESRHKCDRCWFHAHRNGSICQGPKCHRLNRSDQTEVNFIPIGCIDYF